VLFEKAGGHGRKMLGWLHTVHKCRFIAIVHDSEKLKVTNANLAFFGVLQGLDL
jgi:precorrin-6B methylase 2